MLATDLDPMMRAKGKHARTHAIMACLTNMPLRLPLVSQCKVVVMKGGDSDGDAGGGKRRVVVFVFDYKLDLSLNSRFNVVM